jgi:alkylhydroperoxidase family enzyme
MPGGNPARPIIDAPEREAAAVQAAVLSIVSPGATLTGAQRRRLADVARRSVRGGATETDANGMFAERVATEAHTIRAGDVESRLASGMSPATYVEILGLVARLSAVDTFHRGLGLDPAPLPPQVDGDPSGDIDPEATVDGGWVPTVGPASPPNALSLVPDEHWAMHELHGALYLSVEEMADADAERGLHRTQMELVAARTSQINECFF